MYLLLTDTATKQGTLYYRDKQEARIARGNWLANDGVWEWQPQAFAWKDSLAWDEGKLDVKRLNHVEVTVYDDPVWNSRVPGVKVEVAARNGQVLARGATKDNGTVALFYPTAAEQLDVPEMLENIIRMAEQGATAAASAQLEDIAMPGNLSKPLGPYQLRLTFDTDTIQLPLTQNAARLKYYRSSTVKPWNIQSAQLKPLNDDRKMFYQFNISDDDGTRQFQVRSTGK